MWANTVGRFTIEHGLFSLPQTASTAQMEHMATCPPRFAAVLRNGRPSEVAPLAIQILTISRFAEQAYLPSGQTTGHFKVLRLFPGGRFLITVTSSFLMQLWDLGYGPYIMHCPFPWSSILLDVEDVLDVSPQVFHGWSLRVLAIVKRPGYGLLLSLGTTGSHLLLLGFKYHILLRIHCILSSIKYVRFNTYVLQYPHRRAHR
jgi:hypothetical protein